MDELFSKDYHVEYLAKETILTYKEVEERYGIKISGFGRGINITPCAVILISSIAKSKGNFIYHDKWTDSGDYLYSGEGKTGNQSMTKGNLAIKNAAHDGKKIHLFVKFSPQEYYLSLIHISVQRCCWTQSGNFQKCYRRAGQSAGQSDV